MNINRLRRLNSHVSKWSITIRAKARQPTLQSKQFYSFLSERLPNPPLRIEQKLHQTKTLDSTPMPSLTSTLFLLLQCVSQLFLLLACPKQVAAVHGGQGVPCQ